MSKLEGRCLDYISLIGNNVKGVKLYLFFIVYNRDSKTYGILTTGVSFLALSFQFRNLCKKAILKAKTIAES